MTTADAAIRAAMPSAEERAELRVVLVIGYLRSHHQDSFGDAARAAIDFLVPRILARHTAYLCGLAEVEASKASGMADHLGDRSWRSWSQEQAEEVETMLDTFPAIVGALRAELQTRSEERPYPQELGWCDSCVDRPYGPLVCSTCRGHGPYSVTALRAELAEARAKVGEVSDAAQVLVAKEHNGRVAEQRRAEQAERERERWRSLAVDATQALATIGQVNSYGPRETFPRVRHLTSQFLATVAEVAKLKDTRDAALAEVERLKTSAGDLAGHIARESHAVGLSETMAPAERVSATRREVERLKADSTTQGEHLSEAMALLESAYARQADRLGPTWVRSCIDLLAKVGGDG